MFRRFFAILLFAALTSLTGLVHGQEKGFVALNPPQPMPAFVFEDEKGRTHDLKDFHGHYILLNLWSTSCVPCAAEMPTLNALSKKLDSGKFAIIALDEDHEGRIAARSFFKGHNIDHLTIYDDPSGRAPFVLHTRGLPTTYLIDPNGAVIARLEGAADWTQESMLSFLDTYARP